MVRENQVVKREEEILASVKRLDELMVEAAEFSGVNLVKNFSAAVKTARVVRELQECIRPVIGELMPLMNTQLGFKTDKDPSRPQRQKDGSYSTPKPYTEEQVIPVMAEAIIHGVRVTGNQFNIIAANCYLTKEGFAQKLADLADFHNFEEDFLFDKNQDFESIRTCIVKYTAKWEYKSKPGELVRYIPVRLNAGMGPDAAIGKGERKGRKAVWQRVTNIWVPDGDAGDFENVDGVEMQRPKFEPARKTTVPGADIPKEKPVAQEPPPTEPAKPTPPPPQPSNQPADVEEIDPNIGAFLDRVMSSDIDPKWFTQALINNNILNAGQSLKDISPGWAKSAISSTNWPKIFTAAKRLSEGGQK